MRSILRSTWPESMPTNTSSSLRRQGVLVSRGEIDVGLVGMSAPVFAGAEVAGSLGLVATADLLHADPTLLSRLTAEVVGQAAAASGDLAA